MDIDEKVSALYKIRRLDKEEYVLIFDNLIQEMSNPSSKRGYVRLAGQALGRRLPQGSRFGVCFCDGQLQLICPKSMR